MKKVFLLHGWTYSTESWHGVVDWLKQHDIEIVVLHIPGLTASTDRSWTLDDYVTWLYGEIKDEQPVVLVGHSNGGRIVLAFAARYPTHVRRLILVDSAGIPANGWHLWLKRHAFALVAKIGKRLTSSTKLRGWLYRLAREKDYEQASPIMRQTMANMLSVDVRPLLLSINMPTLLLWGAKDRSTPLVDGELMHRHIIGSRLVIIADANHSPQRSHHEFVAEQILHEVRQL